jgi:hypothetical protein
MTAAEPLVTVTPGKPCCPILAGFPARAYVVPPQKRRFVVALLGAIPNALTANVVIHLGSFIVATYGLLVVEGIEAVNGAHKADPSE